MCRQVVDATYAVLVRAMFTQLERTAGPDVKHGDRLRLENYSLLETELKPLASRVTLSHIWTTSSSFGNSHAEVFF
jgi:hypothetical protein